MKVESCEFTVQGVGHFPVDMLRYDRCWPASTEDALAVARDPFERRGQDLDAAVNKRIVRLRMHVRTKSDGPTNDRWLSFGWIVLDRRYH